MTVVLTRVDLAELICGQKLKSKRIAYSFVKPSVKTSAVKRDLYLALDKIKNQIKINVGIDVFKIALKNTFVPLKVTLIPNVLYQLT